MYIRIIMFLFTQCCCLILPHQYSISQSPCTKTNFTCTGHLTLVWLVGHSYGPNSLARSPMCHSVCQSSKAKLEYKGSPSPLISLTSSTPKISMSCASRSIPNCSSGSFDLLFGASFGFSSSAGGFAAALRAKPAMPQSRAEVHEDMFKIQRIGPGKVLKGLFIASRNKRWIS